jgi:hypothetical protein
VYPHCPGQGGGVEMRQRTKHLHDGVGGSPARAQKEVNRRSWLTVQVVQVCHSRPHQNRKIRFRLLHSQTQGHHSVHPMSRFSVSGAYVQERADQQLEDHGGVW